VIPEKRAVGWNTMLSTRWI